MKYAGGDNDSCINDETGVSCSWSQAVSNHEKFHSNQQFAAIVSNKCLKEEFQINMRYCRLIRIPAVRMAILLIPTAIYKYIVFYSHVMSLLTLIIYNARVGLNSYHYKDFLCIGTGVTWSTI